MASVFGHSLVALALGAGFPKEIKSTKFWILGIICSIIPDTDVIGFKFNVAYHSFLGHRGFTHSLLFGLLFGCLVTAIFYYKSFTTKKGLILTAFFTLCTVSHAVLDSLTSGGMGVAFFSPFDTTRYFLPWRPILVSPLGVKEFMSAWGVKVLLSEIIWIGIPSILYILIVKLVKKIKS